MVTKVLPKAIRFIRVVEFIYVYHIHPVRLEVDPAANIVDQIV